MSETKEMPSTDSSTEKSQRRVLKDTTLSHTGVPYKQIRALYDEDTITVYQAYSASIAIPAVKEQCLSASPDFQVGSIMTWIKPSWCWMMYRSGYSYKDSRQEHILAIKMTHENFKQLLSIASVTPALSPTESKKPVRVQWDPERTPQIGILPYRSIQIGISRAVTEKWVREWIVSIEDVTERARELKRAIEVGVRNKEELMERGLMPLEREYVLEQPLRDILGMDREAG